MRHRGRNFLAAHGAELGPFRKCGTACCARRTLGGCGSLPLSAHACRRRLTESHSTCCLRVYRLATEPLHDVAQLRHHCAHGRQTHAQTQQVSRDPTTGATIARTHLADSGSVGLLHLGLKHVFLVVALGAHDLGFGHARRLCGLGLCLCGDDLARRLVAGDLGVGHLLLEGRRTLGRRDLGLRRGLSELHVLVRLHLGLLDLGLNLGQALCQLGSMDVANVAEVGIVLGKHHRGHVKLRHRQAVLFKTGGDAGAELAGKVLEVLVYLKQVDVARFDGLGEIRLYRRGNKRPETVLERLDKAILALLAPGDARGCTHKLDEQLSAVLYLQVHLATCADFERHAGKRVEEAHARVSTPAKRHLHRLVDEVDLAVERAHAARGQVDQLVEHGDVLRLKGVAARAERVERLAVAEEHRLLRLVHDELRSRVEVLGGMLPDEGGVVALVFDDV